jgi:hypothetical protein
VFALANISESEAEYVLISRNPESANYMLALAIFFPLAESFLLFPSHHSAPELYIADENQNPLYERHYEVNSTLELYCYVHNIEMTSSVVLWIHNDHVLNYDAIRGGIR